MLLKISARFQIKRLRPATAIRGRSRRAGFSLIEILLVVLIMGIVLGMTGSLMGGFFNMFEMSEDQSSARMRADNVFSILSMPIQNAGIGVPSEDVGDYFLKTKFNVPVSNWETPIAIDNSLASSAGTFPVSVRSGDRMRIIYVVPTGVQTTAAVPDFSTAASGYAAKGSIENVPIVFSSQIPSRSSGKSYYLTTSGDSTKPYMSRYFTFPGMNMLPMHADSYNASTKTMIASGMQPGFIPSPDMMGANVIRAYHEMHLLRAAVAYVDDSGHFVLMDAEDKDPSVLNAGVHIAFPPASDDRFSGMRVDGIKAINFSQDPEWRFLTVTVLAEGDSASSNNAAQQTRVIDAWADLTGETIALVPGVHYELLSMTYRTRNLQN